MKMARKTTASAWAPMLCGTIDTPPDDGEWYIEPKLDGWRCIAGRHDDGVWLEARSGARLTTVPYINEDIAAGFPADTVLDGELVSTITGLRHGETSWNQCQTVLSRNRVHVVTPESPALIYVVFDVLVYDGVDYRGECYAARRELLERHFGTHGKRSPLVQLNPAVPSSQEALDAILDAGMEGAVVKRLSATYAAGRRDRQFKIKPQDTEDVECIGFYEPEPGSKYDGVAVGGVRFRRANGYEGRAAGMDDVERKRMLTNPEEWVGKVIEIRHHGETVGGAVRHPQYVRVRDDKDKSADDLSMPKISAQEANEEVAAMREESGQTQRTVPTRAPASGGRMRNYGAMGEAKLLRCIEELRVQDGDAYQRCINGGSGDPEADYAAAVTVAEQKGWL
jgi:ATP-dependent DNA ligase